MDEITGYHLDQARAYRLALGPDDERTRVLALRAGRRLAAAGRRTAERDEIPTAVRLLSQAEALLAEDPAARFDTLIELVYVGFDEDYLATKRVAERAEAVAEELDDLARRRARTVGLELSAVSSIRRSVSRTSAPRPRQPLEPSRPRATSERSWTPTWWPS